MCDKCKNSLPYCHCCKHQWFQVKEIGRFKSPEDEQAYKNDHEESEDYAKLNPGRIRFVKDITDFKEYGVLVQCANCEETKELYGESK